MKKIAFALAIALGLLATPALAQTPQPSPPYTEDGVTYPTGSCGPVEPFKQKLVDDYGESVVMQGTVPGPAETTIKVWVWWNADERTATITTEGMNPFEGPDSLMMCVVQNINNFGTADPSLTPPPSPPGKETEEDT